MTLKKIRKLIQANWMFYLTGIVLVFGIKYFYSKAGCIELQWILAPTAWWVRTLTGIPFVFEPDAGYVNYSYRFIIASSCSGVQFMMITMATLIFSFVHRMKTLKRGFLWITLSVGFSYLSTIVINGFRIILSIYLPLYIAGQGDFHGWLTPKRLHTMTGIAVYFTALFLLYRAADPVSSGIACMCRKRQAVPVNVSLDHSRRSILSHCIPPVFWYFAVVLGIPFLNRAYEQEGGRFTEYAVLMLAVCGAILGLFALASILWKLLRKRRQVK